MPRSSNKTVRPSAPRRAGQVAGFTLVELMVTCAVIGILAVVGLPAMNWMINAGRLQGHTSDISAALQMARSEAVRRNASITVCGSSNGAACDGNWANVITVVASNNEVLQVTPVRPPVQMSATVNSITYRANGFTTAAAFTVCMPTTYPRQNQRVLSVTAAGKVSTTKADGSGSCS